MALVGYSDSESSDAEEEKPPALKLPAPKQSKPGLPRVVDRTNTGRIIVKLSDVRSNAQVIENNLDEPQPKRPRLGGEGRSIANFNSFLPAPKRTAPLNEIGAQKGLGKGVNLKTGTTPGFDRTILDSMKSNEDPVRTTAQGEDDSMGNSIVSSVTKTITENRLGGGSAVDNVANKPTTIFKPLSVMRKPAKRKAAIPATLSALTTPKSKAKSEPITKTTLFSIGSHEEGENVLLRKSSAFQPYSFETIKELVPKSSFLLNSNEPPSDKSESHTIGHNEEPSAQSLDSIAADLNLSTSARRQLLGRGKQNGFATNVVNFNTDQEYAANEALRQAGEVQSHNPVRAIASGKHSLKQLVNAATNQKDALEEQFASGRRTKREAGNKYGW